MCRNMESTSAQTWTLCEYDISIPGGFDLPAAVMSFGVKLLFLFNIVYRPRHLFYGIVICPELSWASDEHYQHSV